MMDLQSLIVWLVFAVLSLRMAATIQSVRKRGGELYGRPSISDFVVLFSKFAALFPVALLLIDSAGIKIPKFIIPELAGYTALTVLVIGSVVVYFSLAGLGKYTKMGLPKNDTIRLQTGGIYRFSRNPMYFGLMLISAASIALIPNLLTIGFGTTGIILHHFIILKEEKFLHQTFGNQYTEYKAKTGRYF